MKNKITKPKYNLFLCLRASDSIKHYVDKPCEEAFEICTDEDGIVWAINLDSIQDLLNFISKYGECLVDIEDSGYNTITIHDYYID